jgi:hypothetical protein
MSSIAVMPRPVRCEMTLGWASVGAANLVRYPRMGHGQTLDVGLVDHRLVVLVPRRAVGAPVEERVDDDREQRVTEAVRGVGCLREPELRVVEAVAEERLSPGHRPVDGLGIGVEQELGGIAPLARRRVVGPVHAVAVTLPRLDRGQVDVPDEGVAFG